MSTTINLRPRMHVMGSAPVDLDDPLGTADRLPIATVAHSLATINRYHGHAIRPNSVAEHSLLVVEILEREHGVTHPSVLLAGLLHDAHECITNDLSALAKPRVGEAWGQFEALWQHAFITAYGLRLVMQEHADLIHQADRQACATELRDLLGATPDAVLPADPVQWLRLSERDGMGWLDWRNAFLEQYRELEYRRARRRAGQPDITPTVRTAA